MLVENVVLVADIGLSPLPLETLAAQEFLRGTKRLVESLQPYAALGAAPGDHSNLIKISLDYTHHGLAANM